MQLDPNRTEDPRSTLDKARRRELLHFAKQNGVHEIKPDMPATMMRMILKAKGLTNILIPKRPLGMEGRTVICPTLVTREGNNRVLDIEQSTQNETVEVDAAALMVRQYMEQTATQPTAEPRKRSIAALRAECKDRGIKAPPRATAAELQELLTNGDAS